MGFLKVHKTLWLAFDFCVDTKKTRGLDRCSGLIIHSHRRAAHCVLSRGNKYIILDATYLTVLAVTQRMVYS